MSLDVSKLSGVIKKSAQKLNLSAMPTKTLSPEQLKGLEEAVKKFKNSKLNNDIFQKVKNIKMPKIQEFINNITKK